MATSTVIELGNYEIETGTHHFHQDPDPRVPNAAVVQVMAWSVFSQSNPDGGIGAVVRVENVKTQLAEVPSLTNPNAPIYRIHWDVVNESNEKLFVARRMVVTTP